MRPGKISESVLNRSVIKPIRKYCKQDISADAATLEIPEGMQLVVTTDPVTTAFANLGRLSLHAVINDLAVKGAKAAAVMPTLLLPEDFAESDLRELMEEIASLCSEYDLKILGGHTEVSDAVDRAVISMTGLGFAPKDLHLSFADCKAGQAIVMTKGIGIEGTAILAYDHEAELAERFSPSFVRKCQSFIDKISLAPEAAVAAPYCAIMHDVSEGGLHAALWQLGEQSGLGVHVDFEKILVYQETIEVCELFDLNPYTLISGGTLLAVTDQGEKLTELLNQNGIRAQVIGYMTGKKEKVIQHGEECRYLERPKGEVSYFQKSRQ